MRGQSGKDYDWCINQVLASSPDAVIDDGADLHVAANLKRVKSVMGGCEETTTGVMRLKALAPFPPRARGGGSPCGFSSDKAHSH